MNTRKTIFQAVIIVIMSIILGFANNIVNPNRVKLSTERPQAETAADSTFETAMPSELSEPVVLGKTQLLKLIQDEAVLIIDARTPDEFAAGHITDAINIPFEQLGDYIQQVDELPRDKWLVTYCDGPPCDKGRELAVILFDMGFARVAYYDAGLDDWKTTEEVVQ